MDQEQPKGRRSGLCITRYPDEKILIQTSDGEIEISIAGVWGQRTRLRFSAPVNVKIFREEAAAQYAKKESE